MLYSRLPIVGGIAALIAIGAVACASGSSSTARTSAALESLRSLKIIPGSRTACPGETISSQYEATTVSNSRVTLSAGDVRLLALSGEGVAARGDGSWQTNANPLVSAMSGFRLHASLRSDSTVHGDTIVTPTYGCDKRAVDLRAEARASLKSFIRLGVLRSPFYDSIVVASVEVPGGARQIFVLGPTELRHGAIRVDASGMPGKPGNRGRDGANGGVCERGQPGEDGEEGGSGTSGGSVDLIVQTGAQWLADLVVISNEGGVGGRGGPGGAGGRASVGGRGGATNCPSGIAASGRAGRAGTNGSPGPQPAISTVPFPLIWSGSSLWTNDATRGPLERLVELTQR